MTSKHDEIGALLPLPPATFHILMAVADEALQMSAGTLYRSIQRMQEQGLIIETRERPAPEDDDERRRYYRITAFGLAVARAEAGRLTQMVKLARARGIAPERT